MMWVSTYGPVSREDVFAARAHRYARGTARAAWYPDRKFTSLEVPVDYVRVTVCSKFTGFPDRIQAQFSWEDLKPS